jgi:hypothetical protein
MDRTPSEKTASPGPGKPASGHSEPGRKAPTANPPREDWEPAEEPLDEPVPTPAVDRDSRDILESERSDRDAGRPVQLPDDDLEATPERSAEKQPTPGRRRGDRRAAEGQLPQR